MSFSETCGSKYCNRRIILETDSVQVGPRFCLNPIKIFGGSFGGPTLYENPFYVSPNQVRKVLSFLLHFERKSLCSICIVDKIVLKTLMDSLSTSWMSLDMLGYVVGTIFCYFY